jgi:branched-chain amino acid transport system permease protein
VTELGHGSGSTAADVTVLDPADAGEVAFSVRRRSSTTAVSWGTRHDAGLLVVVVAGLVLFGLLGPEYDVYLLSSGLVFGIVAVGQEWLIGRAGQISIGGAGMMAAGAYTVAFLPHDLVTAVVPALVCAGIVGLGVGFIVGLPGLRFSGLYLLLTTIAFEFIATVVGRDIQGSRVSGFTVPVASSGWLDLASPRTFYFWVVVIAVLCGFLLWHYYRLAPGRAWQTIRESDIAARAIGIRTVRWKLIAFAGSSGITAVAGALYAYFLEGVNYTSFSLTKAIVITLMVFLGGTGSIWGAFVGGVIVTLAPNLINDLTHVVPSSGFQSWMATRSSFIDDLVYGVVFVVILTFARGGIAGGVASLRRRVVKVLR